MSERVTLTATEAEALAKLAYADPGYFCRTFFPHWFPLPMPWLHRGILALLTKQTDWLLKFGEEDWPQRKGVWDAKQLSKILRHFVWKAEPEDPLSQEVPIFETVLDDKGAIVAIDLRRSERTLIIAPRGISKTTLVNAANTRDIVYQETDFLVYLSETATHSEQQLDNIKRELMANDLLISVFGDKRPDRTDPERWTQSLFETIDGVVVAAKGRGGQVRGLNHRGKRPKRIVFDDVEDKESVKTDEQRDKTRTWLKADVEPALPQIDAANKGEILGLGTLLHHDALLVNLSRDPEWVVVRFGAVDPDGDMLWEHYMTRPQYEAKKRSYKRIGKLAEFALEYDSSTRVEEEGAKFKDRFITYKFIDTEKIKSEFPQIAISVDPAISNDPTADFCAFGVVARNPLNGTCHVCDIYMERGMEPRAQVDKYFELHFKWGCNVHGIESVAYQKALKYLVKEEMFRRGKFAGPSAYFEIEPISYGKTGKDERILGILAPRYAAGYITHQRRFPEYEIQLLEYPNEKKDGPDVIAQCIQLLDPSSAYAFDPENEDEDKLAKDQFEALELEEYRHAP